MWEYMLTPIDPGRTYLITTEISWHGRIMMFAWGFLSPLAILVARFAKILPWQKWPEELDNMTWWYSHWIAQSCAILLTIGGVLLVLSDARESGLYVLHRVLGYFLLVCGVFQGISGILRGTKGGPTAPANDGSWNGDHYNMTGWRLTFEKLHKTIGYGTFLLVFFTVPSGLWAANAPKWMFVLLFSWWMLLIATFIILQRRGCAVETYQAIWGTDPKHPGNQMPPAGWGVRRPSDDGTTTLKNSTEK